MGSESLEIDELNQNCQELRSFSETLDKKVGHSEAKASQLGGAYVIFEAIILMYSQSQAISSSADAFQAKRWLPVALSASVSIAFWLTFATTVNECLRIRRQQDLIFAEEERLHRKIFSLQTGRRYGDDGGAAALAKPLAILRFQRHAYVGVVCSALFSFTLLVSYALLPCNFGTRHLLL